MSIFREFGGKSSYYTESELDRLQNPEKYNYTQEQYDAYSAKVQKKADSRQAAQEVSQDAIPYSYVGRGTGATNPAFSFSGYSGHTSGGTSGISGMGGLAGLFGAGTTTETTGQSTGNEGGNQGGGGGPRDGRGGNVQHRAEGGVINLQEGGPVMPPDPRTYMMSGEDVQVQYKQQGGMITSPYADPMNNKMFPPPLANQQEQSGIGGVFEKMQQQFGQQMNQMQSSPLNVYSNYLNQTYTAPQAQEMQAKVTEFVDLVDQAERAHFGVEESFGYGRSPMVVQQGGGGGSMGGQEFRTEQPLQLQTMGGGIASLPPAF